jgi:hypothetical protein
MKMFHIFKQPHMKVQLAFTFVCFNRDHEVLVDEATIG